MLAQLDQTPGVAESRVDWGGRHVLIRLAPGAQADDVVGRAIPILGAGARRLDAAAESEQLKSFRRGERWLRSSDTILLSRREASVLGKRFSGPCAERAGLSEAQTRKLETVLAEEIARLFEWMHANGRGPDDVGKVDLKPTEMRIRTRCREFASADQTDAIIKELATAIGMCDEEDR